MLTSNKSTELNEQDIANFYLSNELFAESVSNIEHVVCSWGKYRIVAQEEGYLVFDNEDTCVRTVERFSATKNYLMTVSEDNVLELYKQGITEKHLEAVVPLIDVVGHIYKMFETSVGPVFIARDDDFYSYYTLVDGLLSFKGILDNESVSCIGFFGIYRDSFSKLEEWTTGKPRLLETDLNDIQGHILCSINKTELFIGKKKWIVSYDAEKDKVAFMAEKNEFISCHNNFIVCNDIDSVTGVVIHKTRDEIVSITVCDALCGFIVWTRRQSD